MLLHKAKAMHITLVLVLFIICLSGKITIGEKTCQDAFAALEISWNCDGSLNRSVSIPMVPPTPLPDAPGPGEMPIIAPNVISKDVFVDPNKKTHVRIFIPSHELLSNISTTKLPLIIYFHGGDFVLFSASTVLFHNFANDVAHQFHAIVVSVEYRLAPENRLPAAYEDAVNVLKWVQTHALSPIGVGGREPWMEYANFSRVFLMGSGAGGNIAYNAAIRAADEDLSAITIKGLLMNQPYFGGVERTESEIRLEDDAWVPLYMNDVLWGLALPLGENRDHPYCNPSTAGLFDPNFSKLPPVYIKGDEGDPLVDRAKILARNLLHSRHYVLPRFYEGGHHSIELVNSTAAQELYDDMKYFVNEFVEVPAAGESNGIKLPTAI